MVFGWREADDRVGLEQLRVGHTLGLVAGVTDQVPVLIEPVDLKKKNHRQLLHNIGTKVLYLVFWPRIVNQENYIYLAVNKLNGKLNTFHKYNLLIFYA